MNLNLNPKFVVGIGIVLIALVALVFFGRKTTDDSGGSQWGGELEIWGVFDSSEVMDVLARSYKTSHGVDVVYRKKASDSYERDLIEAMAAGRGPDLFMVHNTWLPKHADKMMPAELTWITVDQMQSLFPDVVVNDFVGEEGQVWAIPLYVDSLALYYNRDHFNDAVITSPPETWSSFFDAVEKLTRLDERGRIVRAGVAMGTAENVNRSTDILGLLMMQSGSDLVSDNHTRVTFDDTIRPKESEAFVPGEDALRFYTDFSNPSKPIYTWNREQDFSIDMFTQGRASMMLNYQHHSLTLDAKAPYLNYGIAPIPQLTADDLDVNYASYWGLGVSGQSDAPNIESWRFLLWLATEDTQALYQSATGRPPAHRAIIENVKNTGSLGVFARQALTARSWYQPDNNAVDIIFAEAISSVVLGQAEQKNAITTAAKRIEELLRR